MTDVPELGYLIRKNGMFYRPDSCGYTSAKSEAGRYSLKDAIDITHPNGPDGPRDGMAYVHESEVTDPSADLSDAKDARIAELEAERDEAMQEALSLARSLHKTHYSDVTQWETLDYPAGIISQIDNMVAGIVTRAEAAEAKLAVLSKSGQSVVDRWDSIDWKDEKHTADYINDLRATLAQLKGTDQ